VDALTLKEGKEKKFMKLGQAQMDENICFVLMNENGKISKVLFPGQVPEDITLKRDKKADEIAEKVVQWITHGETFFHSFRMTGTSFQQRVYTATQKIPKGKVTTYKVVAEKIGTKAYRAVGQALGANPVPLLVPCHRVVGSDRRLTGFGAGIELKRKILEAEGVGFEGEKVKKEYILQEI